MALNIWIPTEAPGVVMPFMPHEIDRLDHGRRIQATIDAVCEAFEADLSREKDREADEMEQEHKDAESALEEQLDDMTRMRDAAERDLEAAEATRLDYYAIIEDIGTSLVSSFPEAAQRTLTDALERLAQVLVAEHVLTTVEAAELEGSALTMLAA